VVTAVPELRQVPPGRAGRLWLRRRLDTAARGITLLDRKLRILRTEQERAALLAERTGAQWSQRCADADRWLARAALLGGDREIRLCTVPPVAEVTVTWGAVMGTRYPTGATCRPYQPTGTERPPGTAALTEAATAYAAALRAAVEHAAAVRSQHILDREVASTRLRLRALTDRWLPRLEGALSDLVQRLEEAEREETVRIRWAATRDGATP
jgi:V/A-type H+-transporting ATPase subunit D